MGVSEYSLCMAGEKMKSEKRKTGKKEGGGARWHDDWKERTRKREIIILASHVLTNHTTRKT